MMKLYYFIFLFFAGNQSSVSSSGTAMYLYVQHSDSLVMANVRVNGKPVAFEPGRQQYLIRTSLLKRRGNTLIIKKDGFRSEQLDLDSMFEQHRRRIEVTSAVRLHHKWDGTYLQQGIRVPGEASANSILVMGVRDTAAIFKAMKGQNLMLMRMYDYCGNRENELVGENIDTYYFMHCYGAWFDRKNSAELKHLRKIFGENQVGPVIRDSGVPKILTAQLEIHFKARVSADRIRKLLSQFQLKVYYKEHTGARWMIVTADPGMGDHIIGIAHRLQEHPDVEMVSNVVNAMVCPG